jgi:hypothetical protein
MRLSGHIRTAKIFNTRMHVASFIGSIIRKVALIRGSHGGTGYAGGIPAKNMNAFGECPA